MELVGFSGLNLRHDAAFESQRTVNPEDRVPLQISEGALTRMFFAM